MNRYIWFSVDRRRKPSTYCGSARYWGLRL